MADSEPVLRHVLILEVLHVSNAVGGPVLGHVLAIKVLHVGNARYILIVWHLSVWWIIGDGHIVKEFPDSF